MKRRTFIKGATAVCASALVPTTAVSLLDGFPCYSTASVTQWTLSGWTAAGPGSRKTPCSPASVIPPEFFLSDGASYGSGGEGFVRLNIGCPRSLLKEALEQIRKALL